jgi:hypothetical protein
LIIVATDTIISPFISVPLSDATVTPLTFTMLSPTRTFALKCGAMLTILAWGRQFSALTEVLVVGEMARLFSAIPLATT